MGNYFLHYYLLLFFGLTLLNGPLEAEMEENHFFSFPSFFYQDQGEALPRTIVFPDFIQAHYQIVYNFEDQSTSVRSTIDLNLAEDGYIAFDLVPHPQQILLNKRQTTALLIDDPHQTTKFRIINQKVSAGRHQLEIISELNEGVEFTPTGVRSGFFMADLTDRNLLEKYLPVSFEYDQVKMTFDIIFKCPTKGLCPLDKKPVEIFTNGEVSRLGRDHFTINFPEYFNCSSPYFHTAPQGTFFTNKFIFTTQENQKKVPVVIYTALKKDLHAFTTTAITTLRELENDYGDWPHPNLVIYGAGKGGMEYHGATQTSLSALGHELTHSYFARGVMPGHGNAGWVDEAIASWRDNGYQTRNTLPYSSSKMSGHSVYRRSTDRDAYTKGSQFLEYLNYQVQNAGGLKVFLKEFFNNHLFQIFLTSNFQDELWSFFGDSLDSLDRLFDQYVYGKGLNFGQDQDEYLNPYHPELTAEDLRQLL